MADRERSGEDSITPADERIRAFLLAMKEQGLSEPAELILEGLDDRADELEQMDVNELKSAILGIIE